MSSIFISIAAYHDYELPKTIIDAIEKSSGNHEIHFGVSLVYYEENDIPLPDYENAKYVFSKAPLNTGVNTGRNVSGSLYSGQDYFLQIDSHSRFCKDWDQTLVDDIVYYKNMGFQKPAITCYPAQYGYDKSGNEIRSEILEPQNIVLKNEDLFKERLQVENQSDVLNTIFQKSISGGFLFTEGALPKLTDKIAFVEEFPLGVAMYTNGFDLLIPRKLPIYHYYSGPSETDPLAHNRRHVWADPSFNDHLMGMVHSSNEEIIRMFSENICDEEHLGKERSLSEYAEYAGLDFENRAFIKENGNGIVYSFHVREDDTKKNYCYKQLRYSLTTLRSFNSEIPVKVFISPAQLANQDDFAEFDNVEVIGFDNVYPDDLNDQWVSDGYAQFLLHRWDNAFKALAGYRFQNILYLDTDTVFHGDPEILFSKYAKPKSVICREDNSVEVLSAIGHPGSMNDGQFILNKSEVSHRRNLMHYTHRYVNKMLEDFYGKIDSKLYHEMKWILIQIAATNYFRLSNINIEFFAKENAMLHVEVEFLDTSNLILHHYYSGNTQRFVPGEFL